MVAGTFVQLRTFTPGSESSIDGTFAQPPWNFRSPRPNIELKTYAKHKVYRFVTAC